MIERLMTNAAPQAEPIAPEPPRLSLLWYLDPITGKPAPRWVSKVTGASAAEQLAKAAQGTAQYPVPSQCTRFAIMVGYMRERSAKFDVCDWCRRAHPT